MKPLHELDALCAEKVAGWQRVTRKGFDYGTLVSALNAAGERHAGATDEHPRYCSDPAAVLGLLEKEGMCEIHRMHREKVGWQWEVKVWEESGSFYPKGEASAPTLALAGTLALLKAEGVETE